MIIKTRIFSHCALWGEKRSWWELASLLFSFIFSTVLAHVVKTAYVKSWQHPGVHVERDFHPSLCACLAVCYIYREDLDQHLDSLVTKYPDHPSMQAEVCLIRFCLQVKHKVVSWILPVQAGDMHHQAQIVPSPGETGNSMFVFAATSRGVCVLWFCPQVYEAVQVSLNLSVQVEVVSSFFLVLFCFLDGFCLQWFGKWSFLACSSQAGRHTLCQIHSTLLLSYLAKHLSLSLAVSHRQGE